MLSEWKLQEIVTRWNGADPAGRLEHATADVLALLAELSCRADQLAECWALLNRIALKPNLNRQGPEARELLRRHHCPGWKE